MNASSGGLNKKTKPKTPLDLFMTVLIYKAKKCHESNTMLICSSSNQGGNVLSGREKEKQTHLLKDKKTSSLETR